MSFHKNRRGLRASAGLRRGARVESLEGRALFAAGGLDTTWGDEGYVTTGFGTGSSDVPFAVAVDTQGDDKGDIITVGRTTGAAGPQFAVSRHSATGVLKTQFPAPNFGTGADTAYAVAIDSANRVVVAGKAGNSLGVARYSAGGTLEAGFDPVSGTGFGIGGKALVTNVGGLVTSVEDISLAIDNNNRPVIGLTAYYDDGTADLAVVRLTTGGTLDTNFVNSDEVLATPGVVKTNPGGVDRSGGVAIDASGNIVQAGIADFDFDFNGKLVATRIMSAGGERDTAAFSGGTASPTSPAMHLVNSVVLDEDGALVVAGAFSAVNPEETALLKYLALARLSADGTSAPEFVPTTVDSIFPTWSLSVQRDGKFVVAGHGESGAPIPESDSEVLLPENEPDAPIPGNEFAPINYLLARFDYNLALDPSFGDGGVAASAVEGLSATAVVVDSTDRILVAGFDASGATGNDFILARHEAGALNLPGAGFADANTSDTPYVIDEGGDLTLHGSGSLSTGTGGVELVQSQRRVRATAGGGAGGDNVGVVLLWDFNGDGTTDATGPNPTLHAERFDLDGPGTTSVTLRVEDENNPDNFATATVPVTINNVAPALTVSGDTRAVRGQERTLNLAADDRSAADRAAGITFSVDWGDGTVDEIFEQGEITAALTHAYDEAGPYGITVTATDKDGGVATAFTSMQVDVANVDAGVLAVGGGIGGDKIRVYGESGAVTVSVSDVAGGGQEFVQTYAADVDRVVIFGQAGDDSLSGEFAPVPVYIFGGDGNDKLTGGRHNDVLVGGGGDDKLMGLAGRDVLIGGLGADKILGDADDDILVGGYTAHDASLTALGLIAAEWGSAGSYLERVGNLSDAAPSTGVNASVRLAADVTTWDDLVTDVLSGDAGTDWFFANFDSLGTARDKVEDATSPEFADDVDFQTMATT